MGKQVNELDTLSEFTDDCVVPTHNGVGLKKGTIGALTEYLGTKFSNPNLLINPDFAINQRGKTTYTIGTETTYTCDRWRGYNVVVSYPDTSKNSILIKTNGNTNGSFGQVLANETGEECTFSCFVESISGKVIITTDADVKEETTLKEGLNVGHSMSCSKVTIQLTAGSSVVLKWAKLELDRVQTPFVSPERSTELNKCRRYFLMIPQSMTTYSSGNSSVRNFIYCNFDGLQNLRAKGSVVTILDSESNFIRYEGTSAQVVLKPSLMEINNLYARLAFTIKSTGQGDTSLNSKLVGLDISSRLAVDAEIY